MNTRKLILLSVLLTGTAILQPAWAASDEPPLDKVRITPKEFSLGNHHRLTVAHSKFSRHYRICVDAGQGDVALQVTSNGAVRDVAPGDCWDFMGKEIRITPAGRLEPGEMLKGNYLRIRP